MLLLRKLIIKIIGGEFLKNIYSKWSILLIIIGIVLTIIPFSPLNIKLFTNWYALIVGIVIYFVGLILGIIAFAKKESGLLKFISVFSVILFIIGVIYAFNIVGQI
jgi:hypothetical protein